MNTNPLLLRREIAHLIGAQKKIKPAKLHLNTFSEIGFDALDIVEMIYAVEKNTRSKFRTICRWLLSTILCSFWQRRFSAKLLSIFSCPSLPFKQIFQENAGCSKERKNISSQNYELKKLNTTFATLKAKRIKNGTKHQAKRTD